jgi:hypothetical protein
VTYEDDRARAAELDQVADVDVARFAELEVDGAAELLRAHRLELAEHLERVRLTFQLVSPWDQGVDQGLSVAVRELREWPPVDGVE